MIDLSPCDSAYGKPPKHALPVRGQERVLHVHLGNPHEPQTGLCAALKSLGDATECEEQYVKIDWTQFEHDKLQEVLKMVAHNFNPTLVFMQLQTDGVIDPGTIDEIDQICYGQDDSGPLFVSWCGDVGRDPAWSHKLAPKMDAMLFSSMTQVEEHRAAGFVNAAYLQIGYDTDTYYYPPDDATRGHDVIFLGQNYSDTGWTIPHEAELRRQIVRMFDNRFNGEGRKRFICGGAGWSNEQLHFASNPRDREEEAWCYWASKCAISLSLTSSLRRYSSDRLLRALACGPAVLVKRFEEMSSWGLTNGYNCCVWDTPEECLQLATELVAGPVLSKTIGQNGAKLALDKHTWGWRMHELAVYLEYIRGRW